MIKNIRRRWLELYAGTYTAKTLLPGYAPVPIEDGGERKRPLGYDHGQLSNILLSALKELGPATNEQISKKTGLYLDSVRRGLDKLMQEGKVQKTQEEREIKAFMGKKRKTKVNLYSIVE